jgi:hypothetical protein
MVRAECAAALAVALLAGGRGWFAGAAAGALRHPGAAPV